MKNRLWSINALSTEIGLDRRTLTERLRDLPAQEQAQVGVRVEKKWHMRGVLDHLRYRNNGHYSEEVEENLRKIHLLNYIGNQFLPILFERKEFHGLVTGLARSEMGLSKKQAIYLYHAAVFGMVMAAEAALGKDGQFLDFVPVSDGILKDTTAAAKAKKLDEWIAANWPDKPAAPE